MRPFSYKALHSSNHLNINLNSDFGLNKTIASIKGSVKKIGNNYDNALVVLYNKANLLPIGVRKPDVNGHYEFLGLNTSLLTYIVAFDNPHEYNAVIQDMVIPK